MPAIAGNRLVTLHGDESIWTRDLVSGASSRVTGPRDDVTFGSDLFAWGDWVGWNLYGEGTDPNGPGVEHHGFRDARTMGPVQRLAPDQRLVQLSSAGAVIETRTVADGQLDYTYTLRTYGGTTVPLLSASPFQADPQVDGRTVAWIDSAGIAKVAPLAVSPAAPRFLGAAQAPAAGIRVAGRAGWRVDAPYSASLTSCRADVLRGARVVRRLACVPARMRVGVAEFAWDGTYGGHRARAGTYRWRVVATGDGGPALNAAGAARPVVHSVAVGRPTRLVLRSPVRVDRGHAATLAAHLTTVPRSRDRHRTVAFYRRLAGGSWHRVAGVTTGADGTARVRVRSAVTSVYRATFAGSFLDRPATSAARRVRVRR